jgi:hypothetical protein
MEQAGRNGAITAHLMTYYDIVILSKEAADEVVDPA